MNKNEFIKILKNRLSGLPKEELNQTIDYYNEIISDKIEEGLTEEEAISSLGTIEKIVNETLKDVTFSRLVKEKLNLNRKLKTWEIVLLLATSIIWVPLVIALSVVLLALYISLWSGVIALGASAIFCFATSLITIVGIIEIFGLSVSNGIFLIGIGLASFGCGLLIWLITYKLAQVMVVVCKKLVLKIKSLFVKRGDNDEI